MFRYIGLLWNTADPAQCKAALLFERTLRAQSKDWHGVFRANGASVYCAGAGTGSTDAHLLHGERGVVLGTLFDRSGTRKTALSEPESAAILASEGRKLITEYWGRYVAILVDPSSRTAWTLNDPCGQLPCFTTSFRGVTVVFSCITDCIRLQLFELTINWDYVRHRVASGVGQLSRTAVNEMDALHGGECLQLRDGRSSKALYWNPVAISQTNVLEDPDRAALELRGAVRTVIDAWASCYTSVICRLSGGLDSSIMVGCLKNAPSRPRVTAFTLFVPNGPRDERHWARIAAADAKCELIEHPRSMRLDFKQMLSVAPTLHPAHGYVYVEAGALERKLAHERSAQAIWNGEGGDCFFGRYSHRLAAVDYLRRHGVNSELFRHAGNVSTLTNMSIWRALTRSVHARLFGIQDNPASPPRESTIFLSAEMAQLARAHISPASHPWFAGANPMPWTPYLHVSYLLQASVFYDPLSAPDEAVPEPLSPLQSQPIVEACLRIPSYVHFFDGRDRGQARKAFAEDVPAAILNRLWKDRSPGLLEARLAAGLDSVREILLDGVLVREKLLDRDALDASLKASPRRRNAHTGEFYDLLSLEAWLRSWMNVTYRAAAA